MSWIEKLLPPRINRAPVDGHRRAMPEGLWLKCPSCDAVLYRADLEASQSVCPKCSHHLRISARTRLDLLLDAEGRFEIGQEVVPVDALKFRDSRKYPDRLEEAMEETGETDALVVMGGLSTRSHSSLRHLSLHSWAARWVRWSVSASCAVSMPRSNRRRPLSRSQPVVAHGCRKDCCRSCR